MRRLARMILMTLCGLMLAGCASELSFGIWNPVISPDGSEVMFILYRQHKPWVVGMVSTDPHDDSITILDLPKDVNWSMARYSRDMKRLVLRSLCAGDADDCFDNAQGAHIWTAGHDGSGLRRLTPDRVWGHGSPVFCETPDTILYTTGFLGTKGRDGDVIILRTGGKEVPLTPHEPGNPLVPNSEHPLRLIQLPQQAQSDHFLFLASVDKNHPLYEAADPDPDNKDVKEVILEYDSGSVRLAHEEPSNVLANNGHPEVFAYRHMVRKDGFPVAAEIRVSSFGKESKAFSYPGFISELSANNAFDRFAFRGRAWGRSASESLFARSRHDVWIYDGATDKLYPLGIEERFMRLSEQNK